jgi:hypothetical protein
MLVGHATAAYPDALLAACYATAAYPDALLQGADTSMRCWQCLAAPLLAVSGSSAAGSVRARSPSLRYRATLAPPGIGVQGVERMLSLPRGTAPTPACPHAAHPAYPHGVSQEQRRPRARVRLRLAGRHSALPGTGRRPTPPTTHILDPPPPPLLHRMEGLRRGRGRALGMEGLQRAQGMEGGGMGMEGGG